MRPHCSAILVPLFYYYTFYPQIGLNMFKLCLSSSNYLTLPSKNTKLFSSQMLSYQHRASPNETRRSVPCRLLLKSVLVFSKNPQKIPKISK